MTQLVMRYRRYSTLLAAVASVLVLLSHPPDLEHALGFWVDGVSMNVCRSVIDALSEPSDAS